MSTHMTRVHHGPYVPLQPCTSGLHDSMLADTTAHSVGLSALEKWELNHRPHAGTRSPVFEHFCPIASDLNGTCARHHTSGPTCPPPSPISTTDGVNLRQFQLPCCALVCGASTAHEREWLRTAAACALPFPPGLGGHRGRQGGGAAARGRHACGGRGSAPPSRASCGETFAPKRRLPNATFRAASARCDRSRRYVRPLSARYTPARLHAYMLGGGASVSR